MIRVLVADDDPTIIHFIEKSLMTLPQYERQFDVFSTFGGREALDVYQRNGPTSFHVVVTDYQMPGGTGLWLIERVLKLRPDQHIVVQSSERGKLPLPQSVVRIHKPYGIKSLVRAMRQPVQPLLF
jgi:CheY-like chemotaxis protein